MLNRPLPDPTPADELAALAGSQAAPGLARRRTVLRGALRHHGPERAAAGPTTRTVWQAYLPRLRLRPGATAQHALTSRLAAMTRRGTAKRGLSGLTWCAVLGSENPP
jgi:hypothetical protein